MNLGVFLEGKREFGSFFENQRIDDFEGNNPHKEAAHWYLIGLEKFWRGSISYLKFLKEDGKYDLDHAFQSITET